MIFFILTVVLTLGVSAICSMLEAMVLSTTPLEIETLKRKSPRRGELLETFVAKIDETSSAILTANTIANTFGATLAGIQFASLFGAGTIATTYAFPALMTVGILLLSEILPKNFGLIYRPSLQPWAVYPLHWLRIVMRPVSLFTSWLLSKLTSRRNMRELSDDEIIMLADKGQKDGVLSSQERDLIANSLSLADITIAEIMTPRTVVTAFEENMSVDEVFDRHLHLNFSRFPVYKDTIDNIVGVIRRRDILLAAAEGKGGGKIIEYTQPAIFVPENGSALAVLRQLIMKHQPMGIAVDEFGSLTGVVTLEDIFEHLLGSEIFEADDIAVDMREFARTRVNNQNKS